MKTGTVIRFYLQDEVNQEQREKDVVDGMKYADAYRKQRLVICNEENACNNR